MAGPRTPLLPLPVHEAAERIARNHLAAATRALVKLRNPGNARELHAFRVAIRRLRSLLRAYRPWIGKAAGGKLRRGLRDLTRATNPARDIDIELAWLDSERRQLAAEDRPGFDWLRRRLAGGRREAYREARARLRRDFPAVAKLVRKRMNRVRAKRPPSYRAAFLELLDADVAAFRERIGAIKDANDERAIHRTRIQLKRLRYLVEPLRGELAEAREAVRPLKKIQTVLGDLHDRHVLEAALAEALDEAATEKARRLHRLAVGGRARKAVADAKRADEALGLVVLASFARDEREALFGRFRQRLGPTSGEWLSAELGALRAAAACVPPGARPPPKSGR